MRALKQVVQQYRGLIQALVLASAVSIGFYVVGAIFDHGGAYWYLVWNLFLAWLPLVFAVWLVAIVLPKYGWNSWIAIVLTLLWLGFLPNSFYIVTDFVHISGSTNDLLYQVIMLMSFALNGLVLGFMSLYIIHIQLLKRLKSHQASGVVAFILLLTSFAMYLGRNLRWNSWDILTNPAGILFDVSDRLIHPTAHLQTFSITLTLFGLLGSVYFAVWHVAKTLPRPKI